jgi:spore coat protein CotH
VAVSPLLLLACAATGPIALSPLDSAPADDPVEDAGGSPPDTDTAEPVVEERLFDEETFHDLSLELSQDSMRSLARNPSRYVAATLVYEDQSLEVGVHIKGSSTFSPLNGKPSLKVNVDWSVPDQDFLGHKKFNLHNQLIDPSMMSEMMSYATLRAAGVPAPRAAYARLTINDQPYGLYTVVEQPDGDFLDNWFPGPDGNLYEDGGDHCDLDHVSCFEKERDPEGSDDALDRLAADSALTGDAWDAAMQADLDWDAFVRGLAIEALIAHWDSYSYDTSNYRIYHDPAADKMTFLPWSMDLDYGWRPWSYPTCGRYGVDPGGYTMGVLAASCQASATCHAAFLDELETLNDWWEAQDPVGRAQALSDWIRPEVYADDRKYYGNDDFEDHVACVEAWLAQRPDEIRAWIAEERAR